MASVVTTMDDLVKDYLLFRGFSSTLKHLDTEIRQDRDRGLRADRIMELLQQYVSSYDINQLREFWNYLDTRYFSRLEQKFMSTVRKLEINMLRFYVVNAVLNNRSDKVQEFFEKMAADSHLQSEWGDWFAIPFAKNPAEVPIIQMYLQKSWQDRFLLSLHNFLSVIFQSMPLPSLLMFDDDLKRMKSLQKECDRYKRQLTALSVDSFEYLPDMTQFSDMKPKQVMQYNHLEPVDDFFDKSSSDSPVVMDEETKGKGVKKLFNKIGTPASPTPKLRNATISVPPNHAALKKTSKESLPKQKPARTKKLSLDSVVRPRPEVKPVSETTRDLGIPESDGSKPYILLSQDEYSEHHSAITHCRFSDTGKHVASADMDGVVKIWALNPTPTTLTTIMSKASIMCFEWASKLDRLILLGNKAAQLKLYNIKEKKNLIDVTWDAQYPRITALLSNPDSSHFTCAASSKGGGYLSEKSPRTGKLSLWQFQSMEMLKEISTGQGSSAVTSMTYNRTGQLLLLGLTNGTIRLYDTTNWDCVQNWSAHNGDVYSVQFSLDEMSCYSLGADGRFVQWTLRGTGSVVHEYGYHTGLAGPFTVSSFTGQKTFVTPRGRLFACDGERRCVLTCRENSGVIYSLGEAGVGQSEPLITLNGHKHPVITVDWSQDQDSRRCLTGSVDGKIVVSTLLK